MQVCRNGRGERNDCLTVAIYRLISKSKCKIKLRVFIKSKLALIHQVCFLYKAMFLPCRENFHTARSSKLYGIFSPI